MRAAHGQGFTLLELMIALVLLSLVLVVLVGGLRLGDKMWNGTEDKHPDMSPVQDFLRGVLSEARPVLIRTDATKAPEVVFDGRANSIRFLGPVLSHLGVGGLYEISIYAAQDSPSLRFAWRLYRPDALGTEMGDGDQHTTLLDPLGHVEFAYFGALRSDKPPRWYSEWRDRDHLPSLIRVRATFPDGAPAWPDLLVAPMAREQVRDPAQLDN